MTVLIHPTLAKADAQQTLRKMELNFDLQATTTGHLVHLNGKHPEMRSAKFKPVVVHNPNHGPYNGGGAAA